MMASADMAPAKTVILECRMAMMAAMKNVLSPSSETIIIERDATKACTNPSETTGPVCTVCSEVGGSPMPGATVGGWPSSSSTGNERTAAVVTTRSHNTHAALATIFQSNRYYPDRTECGCSRTCLRRQGDGARSRVKGCRSSNSIKTRQRTN